MRHIVAVSGGKDSTAMALWLAENEPREYEYVCTPTGDEPDALFAHWRKLSTLLGKPIIPVTHRLGLNALVYQQRAIPNWRQRWCTRMLKIEPFAAYLMRATPATSYVGLRADEELREGGDYTAVPNVIMDFPLRRIGWTVDDVLGYLTSRGVEIPKRTDCKRCFYQRLIEWYELWRDDPAAYEEAEVQEAITGYTWRSPGRDTQPTALCDLRRKFETGWVPRDTRPDAISAMKCRVCTK